MIAFALPSFRLRVSKKLRVITSVYRLNSQPAIQELLSKVVFRRLSQAAT